ncbi:hypothetical protein ACET3Z_032508 [Daucus carota]
MSNIFVQNSLINLYAKCGKMGCAELMFDSCGVVDFVSSNIMVCGYVRMGRLDDARKVFDEMPKRGAVTYTTMIMGLAKKKCWGEAVELFRDMRLAGVMPNEVTMSSVISAYSRIMGVKNGNVIHGFVVKIGLASFGLVLTNLVNIYCVSSCLWDGRRLFDEMAEKNIVTWNVMLNGYSKAGFVDLARDLFDRIPDKDVVSWGTLIDGYVQVGRLNDALIMYREMLSCGLVPNEVMAVDLILACRQAMAFGTGRQLHGVSVKLGFDSYDFMQATIINFYAAFQEIVLAQLQFELGNKAHIESWNALISGFIKNGMIEPARKLFNEMPERDVLSWSSMIAGYAQHEQPNLALELFNEMVFSEFRPNEITMVKEIIICIQNQSSSAGMEGMLELVERIQVDVVDCETLRLLQRDKVAASEVLNHFLAMTKPSALLRKLRSNLRINHVQTPPPTGANMVPGTEPPDFSKLLNKCKLNITATRDAAIRPACVPSLGQDVVLFNHTHSYYPGPLNDTNLNWDWL